MTANDRGSQGWRSGLFTWPPPIRRPAHPLVAVGVLAVALLAVVSGLRLFRASAAVLLPVYQIEAESNGHQATIANLPLKPVGVIGVPTPVDVDGDRVSDIVVTISVVDLVGGRLAPTLEIVRDPLAIALAKPSPPVRVQVRLTVKDEANLLADKILRFGYDTGADGSAASGSIPQSFKAVLGGLENFYNPLTADVSTNGYEGPLDLVGGVADASGLAAKAHFKLGNPLTTSVTIDTSRERDAVADLRLGFRPLPGGITVTYGNGVDVVKDGSGKYRARPGQNVLYQHNGNGDVDLDATAAVFSRVGKAVEAANVTARIDRLPARIQAGVDTRIDGGGLSYLAAAQARPPDVKTSVASAKLKVVPGGLEADTATTPLYADVDVESLPAELAGQWTPVGFRACAGRLSASSDGGLACAPSGQIGAVEADVRFFPGAPKALTPFIPDQAQYVSYQRVPAEPYGKEQWVQARVERVVDVAFAATSEGIDGALQTAGATSPASVNVLTDTRTEPDGSLLSARATIDPLPDHVTFTYRQAGANQVEQPLTVGYTGSGPVDVRGRVEYKEAGGGDACGEDGTVCADVAVRRLPEQIDVRVGTLTAQDLPETRVYVDAVPRVESPAAELTVDALVGQDDGAPLVAQGRVVGLPPHVSIRAQEGVDEDLGRVEFHACTRQFDEITPHCVEGTEGEIGDLSFSVRNWVDRPQGFPVVVAEEPRYATFALRGAAEGTGDSQFEATGSIAALKELQFRSAAGIVGLRQATGGAEQLGVRVDVAGVDFEGDAPTAGKTDIVGAATFTNLPSELDFCFRRPGQEIVELGDAFTEQCEDDNPFEDETPLSKSVTSFGYRAPTPFGMAADFTTVQHGGPTTADDDHTERASLTLPIVPPQLVAHVQAPPPGTTGLTRALYVADEAAAISADIAYQSSDGDLVCEDARVPKLGRKAVCIVGHIDNLPTRTLFSYDPSARKDNLKVSTNTRADLKGLALSSVEGVRKSTVPSDPDYSKVVPKVLVVTGDVTGLPSSLNATLDVPEGGLPTVDVTAEPAIDNLSVTVRNFIAPDPFVTSVPDRATEYGDPTQKVTFRQRGGDFKAELVDIKNVRGVGYGKVKDAAGNPLDTDRIRMEFGGPDEVTRAHADLQPGPGIWTIADVTVKDAPSGLSFCLRNKKTAGAEPAPAEATFCDGKPVITSALPFEFPRVDDDDGAFEFSAASPGLSLDAYFRLASSGGGDVISGLTRIEGLPGVVRGTFPTKGGGDIDIGGYDAAQARQGIDFLAAEVASYDLTGHGYVNHPVPNLRDANLPFQGITPGAPHLALTANDDDLHASVATATRSKLQRIRVIRTGDHAADCPAATATGDLGGNSVPADYPQFPKDSVSTYTCVRSDVVASGGPDEQLSLALDLTTAGRRITLGHAGVTKIPAWLQATLTDTNPLHGDGRFFRQCSLPPAPDDPPGCIAPLLRVDQPSDAVLFGMLRLGSEQDVAELAGVNPGTSELADLDALPFDGWTEWGADATGLRVKVALSGEESASRTAAQVGLRLAVPRSLTVGHVQTWSRTKDDTEHWRAADVRAHVVARGADGAPVASLGELAGLVQLSKGDKVLLAHPSVYTRGVVLPGETGVDLYHRADATNAQEFIQLDGRLSSPMHLSLRTLPGRQANAILPVTAQVLNLPATRPSDDARAPSFRLRAEYIGVPAGPPAPVPCVPDPICHDIKASVHAIIDFDPDTVPFGPSTDHPARRVDMVVRVEGGANGIEIESFKEIGDTQPSPDHPVMVGGYLELNPLNLSIYFEPKGFASPPELDLRLAARLRANLNAERTTNLSVTQNVFRVTGFNAGPNPASIGPVDVQVALSGVADSGILWQPLFIFGAAHSPPVAIGYAKCEAPDGTPITPYPDPNRTLTLNPGVPAVTVLEPFDDPRIQFRLLTVFNLDAREAVKDKVRKTFCFGEFGPHLELIHMTANGQRTQHPGDPLGPSRTERAVPGTPQAQRPAPPAVQQPAPPSDLVVEPGTVATLCGTHTFNTVHVKAGGTVRVGGPQGCTELRLLATSITVDGTIDASGVSDAAAVGGGSPATGNGGGGHYGAGGDGNGTGGQGGTPGFGPVTGPTIEPGARGGGDRPGLGGGALTLSAGVIDINGALLANGNFGWGESEGTCNGEGLTGSGGGAGGGIVLLAESLDTTGATIQAQGGPGGAGRKGGGGGGGGGIVKTFAPLRTGTAGVAGGGPGGLNWCNRTAAGAGGAGRIFIDDDARSQAQASGPFWWGEGDVHVPFSAAAAGSTGFQVVLCGVHLTTDEAATTRPTEPLPFRFDMPGGTSASAPCGRDASGPRPVLDYLDVPAPTERVPYQPPASVTTLTPGTLAEGHWGFWTTVLRPPRAGIDCLVPEEPEPEPERAPRLRCIVEARPPVPDLVIGVDNSPPPADLIVRAPAATNQREIALQLAPRDQADLSGLATVTCRNGAGPERDCAERWELPDADGTHVITVTATDVAGNARTATASVVLDRVVPVGEIVVAPDIGGGWHTSAPAVELRGFVDDRTGRGSAPFAYSIDEGAERLCPASPCSVDGSVLASLRSGEHTLRWSPIDAAGNRLTGKAMHAQAIRIDRDAPLSALAKVPAAPDGSNEWYKTRPTVTFTAVDQAGASGFDAPHAGVVYSVDDGPSVRYDGSPFQLQPGMHKLCWSAVDVAGNAEAERCQTGIKVDGSAPAVTISTSPLVPDGAGGWYVTAPVVTASASDTAPGSGIDRNVSSTGVFVSVDGGDFGPHNGPLTLAEGRHEVLAYAVDLSGQRSEVVGATYSVDLTAPLSFARSIPPEPAQAGWWRRGPNVAMWATDERSGSGVSQIEYRLDDDPFHPYTGRIGGPAGVHSVTLRARDRAGHVGTDGTVSLPVDLTAPQVHARSAQPGLWIAPPSGPAQIKLRWAASDDLSDNLRAVVVVHNSTGKVVRRIAESSPRPVLPGGVAREFETLWDGTGDDLLTPLVAGSYYYRVVVADEAGNLAHSTESAPFTVALRGL